MVRHSAAASCMTVGWGMSIFRQVKRSPLAAHGSLRGGAPHEELFPLSFEMGGEVVQIPVRLLDGLPDAGDDEPDTEAGEQQAATEEEPFLEALPPERLRLVDQHRDERQPDEIA